MISKVSDRAERVNVRLAGNPLDCVESTRLVIIPDQEQFDCNTHSSSVYGSVIVSSFTYIVRP